VENESAQNILIQRPLLPDIGAWSFLANVIDELIKHTLLLKATKTTIEKLFILIRWADLDGKV